jgi:hypothetical protein
MDGSGFKIEVPVVVEPWRKVLLDAADYIDVHGWCRGGYGDDGGPRCILGAIRSVVPAHSVFTRGVALAAVNVFAARFGFAVSDWNDTPGRTAAEVCAALRACATA